MNSEATGGSRAETSPEFVNEHRSLEEVLGRKNTPTDFTQICKTRREGHQMVSRRLWKPLDSSLFWCVQPTVRLRKSSCTEIVSESRRTSKLIPPVGCLGL